MGLLIAVIVVLVGLLAAAAWRARRLAARLAEGLRHEEEIERFRAITHALLGGQELAEVLTTVTSAAADLIGGSASYVVLRDAPTAPLMVAAAAGTTSAYLGRPLPPAGSVAGWVVEHGESALINDLLADPRAYRAANERLGLAREVIVPLVLDGVTSGALGVDRTSDMPEFGPHDLALLERLGEQVVLAIGSARTLDHTRRARASLAAKNTELEQAVRAKTEFLRNMSHELRTPLNSIIGFTELITTEAAGPLTAPQREYLETVARNSRHLLQLINDLLDLSKIDAGKMELHLSPTAMPALIDSVLHDTRGLIGDRRLTVKTDITTGPVSVVCDEVRIRQVLFNFVSNAVKFTPDGGEITVRAVRTAAPLPVPAERTGDTARLKTRPSVWVAVADTGPGIRPEDMPKLFQEFSQVDSSTSRKSGGTGLGLVLCRRFIELHGGTIGAESVPGAGSSFWVLLPEEGPVRLGAGIKAGDAPA